MCGVRGRGHGWGPNLSRPLFNNDTKPLLDNQNFQQKFQKHLHPFLTQSILLLIQNDPAVSIIFSYKCVFDCFLIFAHTCVPYYTLVSSIVQL